MAQAEVVLLSLDRRRGNALRILRAQAGLTQGTLADACPTISQAAVSLMENGKQAIRLGDLSELAAAIAPPLGWTEDEVVLSIYRGETITRPSLAPVGIGDGANIESAAADRPKGGSLRLVADLSAA